MIDRIAEMKHQAVPFSEILQYHDSIRKASIVMGIDLLSPKVPEVFKGIEFLQTVGAAAEAGVISMERQIRVFVVSFRGREEAEKLAELIERLGPDRSVYVNTVVDGGTRGHV